MVDKIFTQIANEVGSSIPYFSLIAGVIMKRKMKVGDKEKIIAVAINKEKSGCKPNDYISLMPSKDEKGVFGFQLGEAKTEESTNGFYRVVIPFEALVWVNLSKTESSDLRGLMEDVIKIVTGNKKFPLLNGVGAGRVLMSGFDTSGKSIFDGFDLGVFKHDTLPYYSSGFKGDLIVYMSVSCLAQIGMIDNDCLTLGDDGVGLGIVTVGDVVEPYFIHVQEGAKAEWFVENEFIGVETVEFFDLEGLPVELEYQLFFEETGVRLIFEEAVAGKVYFYLPM